MDSVAITEGIGLAASAVVFLVGLGMTWQKSKSRSEESQRLIKAEEGTRKTEVARVEALVTATEARAIAQFNAWALSRKAHDDMQTAVGLSQTQLLQALGTQMGRLEGMMSMMTQGNHKQQQLE